MHVAQEHLLNYVSPRDKTSPETKILIKKKKKRDKEKEKMSNSRALEASSERVKSLLTSGSQKGGTSTGKEIFRIKRKLEK